MDLPKTEQELNDLIEARVNDATEKLVAKHNGEMATMRQKHDADLKKAREQANLSAEEIAQQKIKEQQDADYEELQALRTYKKSNEIANRLAKEGLPTYFKNDTRLLSAEEGNVDKVIKEIRKEYEASLPKGATHSTVVNTQSTSTRATGSEKDQAYEKMGDALREIISQN